MAKLTCQIVRPDKLLYEGDASKLVLVGRSGEIGVLPGHAEEICALGSGVMRLSATDEAGGGEKRVVISGGYAEITGARVIVLADHARDVDDIDVDVVNETREKAEQALAELPADSGRRAYHEAKIAWCDLLLKNMRQ